MEVAGGVDGYLLLVSVGGAPAGEQAGGGSAVRYSGSMRCSRPWSCM